MSRYYNINQVEEVFDSIIEIFRLKIMHLEQVQNIYIFQEGLMRSASLLNRFPGQHMYCFLQCNVEFIRTIHHQEMVGFFQNNCII